jgi:hypothetical protein
MRRHERVDARIVDEDINLAVSKFDRSSRNFTGTRGVPKVRRDKVRLSTGCSYFGDRLFAAFHIPAYDQHVNAQLGQFVSDSSTNTTRRSGNECGRIHFEAPFFGMVCFWFRLRALPNLLQGGRTTDPRRSCVLHFGCVTPAIWLIRPVPGISP